MMDFVIGGLIIAFVLGVLIYCGDGFFDEDAANRRTSYEDEDIWM